MKTKLVSMFSALAMAAASLGAPAISHAYGRHAVVITSPVHVVHARPRYHRVYGGGPVVVVRHQRHYRGW